MTISQAVAAARHRKKHNKEVTAWVAPLAVIVAMVALVSWGEYQLFDFVEPWIRIVGIVLAWIASVALFVHSIGSAKVRNRRLGSHTATERKDDHGS